MVVVFFSLIPCKKYSVPCFDHTTQHFHLKSTAHVTAYVTSADVKKVNIPLYRYRLTNHLMKASKPFSHVWEAFRSWGASMTVSFCIAIFRFRTTPAVMETQQWCQWTCRLPVHEPDWVHFLMRGVGKLVGARPASLRVWKQRVTFCQPQAKRQEGEGELVTHPPPLSSARFHLELAVAKRPRLLMGFGNKWIHKWNVGLKVTRVSALNRKQKQKNKQKISNKIQ